MSPESLRKARPHCPSLCGRLLSAQAGDRVRYVIQDGEVRIIPVRSIDRLFGVLRHDGPAVTLEDMERAIVDGARRA